MHDTHPNKDRYGKFKDTRGKWRTKSLFAETNVRGQLVNPVDPIYTLKDYDLPFQSLEGKGEILLPSFKRLYLDLGDPTEYTQAKELLGGWKHWQVLTACSWFAQTLAELREEVEVAIRCQAARTLLQEAESGSKGALQAARALLNKEHYGKQPKGRPTKEAVEREAKINAETQKRLEEDAERIGLLN